MPRTKGSTRVTDAERKRFRYLREKKGLSVARAAKAIGRSEKWGYDEVSKERLEQKRLDELNPNPRPLAELDGGVKDTLFDFSLFEETFFAFRPVPWRRDAAMRVADMLLDPSPRKQYVVINTPPGAGKTSCFTFIIPIWLICGGGSGNPEVGRAIRTLLGHAAITRAERYVLRIRNVLESPRPFSYFDKALQERFTAELSLVKAFGRFKPERTLGEPSVWKAKEITVAQLLDIDLSEKEPTVQAASYDSEFLGDRIDYSVWDDLVNRKTALAAEPSAKMNEWHDDIAETRVEEGGVHAIVGQRLGPLDLFRHNLNKAFTDSSGNNRKKYEHIVYPAHNEATCDGEHRQWDAKGDGCLLDARRLPWEGQLETLQTDPRYRTVFQQEDSDPTDVLVQEVWLDGGTDRWHYPAPGCYDRDRGFLEWPPGYFIDVVTVDPAAGNYWAIEWWALEPASMLRFLIWGARKRLTSGAAGDKQDAEMGEQSGFLDWDNRNQKHVGLMETMQLQSGELGHPIRLWIIEGVSAFKYLFQQNHFITWQRKWANVRVIPMETQQNKNDSDFGVQGLLPMPYKQGLKRLPRKHGDLDALNYLRTKTHELTKWPHVSTEDTVMADWFFEHHLEEIKELATRGPVEVEGLDLPDYVLDQQEWVNVS